MADFCSHCGAPLTGGSCCGRCGASLLESYATSNEFERTPENPYEVGTTPGKNASDPKYEPSEAETPVGTVAFYLRTCKRRFARTFDYFGRVSCAEYWAFARVRVATTILSVVVLAYCAS